MEERKLMVLDEGITSADMEETFCCPDLKYPLRIGADE